MIKLIVVIKLLDKQENVQHQKKERESKNILIHYIQKQIYLIIQDIYVMILLIIYFTIVSIIVLNNLLTNLIFYQIYLFIKLINILNIQQIQIKYININ